MSEKVKDLWDNLATWANDARLTNNRKPLYSSDGDIFIVCLNILIRVDDYVKSNKEGAFYIPTNLWQRLASWVKRKYEECLKSIRDGIEINQFHFSYSGGFRPLMIMDSAHRTRTLIGFLLGEKVVTSPNDTETELKIADSFQDNDKKAKKVTFKDLSDSTKRNFESRLLDCVVYFPITESNWEQLQQTSGQINVGDFAEDLEKNDNKELKIEYDNFIQQNFRKLQEGQPMDANDIAKASSQDGEAYFSNQLEEMAKTISGSMCDKSIGVKKKTDMLARICHTIEIFANGYNSGSRKMPSLLEKTPQVSQFIDKYNNEDRDKTKKLIRQLKTLLKNFNDTQEVFNNHINSFKPSFDTSFGTGRCFPISTGWILISFYFLWVKRNYVIEEQNDMIAIAKLISDLFNKVSLWLKIRKTDQTEFIKTKPVDESSLDHIAWEWVYIRNSSSGMSNNNEYWKLLVKTMELSGLTRQGVRKTFDKTTVNAVAASQNNQDLDGDPLPQDINIHHKVEISKGGTNDIDNLQALSTSTHKQQHAA